MAEVTSLRKKLREANAEFKVVKNTLIRLAAKGTDFAKLDDVFTGPTAVGFAKGDPVALDGSASRDPDWKSDLPYCDCEVLLDRTYFVPLGDPSWPDDTLVEFEYMDGGS